MTSHSPLNLVFFFHNAVCQNELYQFQIFFFTSTSGYTSKHHLNFMLVTELQRRQSNSIAKHLKTVFLHPQHLFVAGKDPVSGHLTLTPLVAAYKNHSHKEASFFSSRGCLLTTASTL